MSYQGAPRPHSKQSTPDMSEPIAKLREASKHLASLVERVKREFPDADRADEAIALLSSIDSAAKSMLAMCMKASGQAPAQQQPQGQVQALPRWQSQSPGGHTVQSPSPRPTEPGHVADGGGARRDPVKPRTAGGIPVMSLDDVEF